MDIVIEEQVLDKFIEETDQHAESQHRGIHNFLIQIRNLGYLWRGPHRIILYNGDCSGDFDESYASYLDKRASGFKLKFK